MGADGWSWASFCWGVVSGVALCVAALAAAAMVGTRRKSPVVGRREAGFTGDTPAGTFEDGKRTGPTRKTQWD